MGDKNGWNKYDDDLTKHIEDEENDFLTQNLLQEYMLLGELHSLEKEKVEVVDENDEIEDINSEFEAKMNETEEISSEIKINDIIYKLQTTDINSSHKIIKNLNTDSILDILSLLKFQINNGEKNILRNSNEVIFNKLMGTILYTGDTGLFELLVCDLQLGTHFQNKISKKIIISENDFNSFPVIINSEYKIISLLSISISRLKYLNDKIKSLGDNPGYFAKIIKDACNSVICGNDFHDKVKKLDLKNPFILQIIKSFQERLNVCL